MGFGGLSFLGAFILEKTKTKPNQLYQLAKNKTSEVAYFSCHSD